MLLSFIEDKTSQTRPKISTKNKKESFVSEKGRLVSIL